MGDTLTVGERLIVAQRRAGMTQRALAGASGVAPATIRRIAAGTHSPRLDTAARLAAALGVDARWLLFGDEKGGGR